MRFKYRGRSLVMATLLVVGSLTALGPVANAGAADATKTLFATWTKGNTKYQLTATFGPGKADSTFTSVNLTASQKADGLTRSGSISSLIPNSGFKVQKDGSNVEARVNTGNAFGDVAKIDITFRGDFRNRCDGHVLSSDGPLNRNAVGKFQIDMFGEKLNGPGDAPTKANVTTWDGKNSNDNNCPPFQFPTGKPPCFRPGRGLSASGSNGGSVGLSKYKVKKNGQMVDVVDLTASMFTSNYQGSGLTALQSIRGRIPANKLLFGSGDPETATLMGHGDFTTGQLEAERSDPYNNPSWIDCKQGQKVRQHRQLYTFGSFAESNYALHFMEGDSDFAEGAATFGKTVVRDKP